MTRSAILYLNATDDFLKGAEERFKNRIQDDKKGKQGGRGKGNKRDKGGAGEGKCWLWINIWELMNLLSSNDLSKGSINEIFKIADTISSGKEELTAKGAHHNGAILRGAIHKDKGLIRKAIIQLGRHADIHRCAHPKVTRG
jgi:hypothetical protein